MKFICFVQHMNFICGKIGCVCYKSWIKSGILYVKELFDDNGFKNIEMFRDRLRFKNNWICEYNTLKRGL